MHTWNQCRCANCAVAHAHVLGLANLPDNPGYFVVVAHHACVVEHPNKVHLSPARNRWNPHETVLFVYYLVAWSSATSPHFLVAKRQVFSVDEGKDALDHGALMSARVRAFIHHLSQRTNQYLEPTHYHFSI